MRSGAESIYSSSSSSYEYIDISHSFPPNKSGLKTFFTAPSERRLRKRRSSRLLRHSNSSSESVGDLAYGHGYLRRPKRKVRSRKGKDIDRERYSERERERERYTEKYSERYSDREREKSGIGRATTDAEILAVGAGLAKLAREQNKLDLKAAARGGKQVGTSRGLGPSRISHGSDAVDEDGWESASDAESESSVDSRLAFGAESTGGWGFFGRKTYKPQSRKSSVVDPRLFGPANSLHGVVTQPVGFGEVSWNSSSDFGQYDSHTVGGRAESVASGSLPPMQHVYPYATEDSTKFDAGRSSVISGPEPYVSSRPGPIPIQQPQPITPVSQSMYDPIYGTRSETGSGILKKTPTSSSGRSKSLAEAALFGVAGAAVGAAIASDRKEDRKERHRDDDREEDRTPKRRDSERKETRDDRKRDKRDSPDRDDRKERRREKDRSKDSPDDRKDKKREKRRDDGREETRDERRERRREERRSERGDDRYDDRRSERSDDRYESRRTKSETAVPQVAVDPFQYQVDNDAFATPNNEPATGHSRIQSVPTVVTVEREPDFTRKRSSSIKDKPDSYRSEPGTSDYYSRGNRDSRDEPLHNAERIYEEERHFTAPIDAAAISAAIAAEGYRESRSERRRDERRGERRSDYDDYDTKPRDKESKRDSRDYNDYDRKPREKDSKGERERDPIQEEADRAYREIVMARKIASQVIRSRSPSPSGSVLDKYEEKEQEEVIRIVTPPGMEDHKKKGLYDAPNADFQLDYVLENPRELRRFSLPPVTRDRSSSDAPILKKDPDASGPRPFLNLVLPTPTPSPTPEKQVAQSEPAQPSKPQVQTATTAASDVVIGPRGNIVETPSASTVSKGVTWGENETKHFEVESPSEHRDEFVSSSEMRARDDPVGQPKTKSRDSPVEQPKSSNGSKRSGWGAIAAGIIGASAGAAAASASETSEISKSSKTKEDEKKQDASYEYRGVVVEPDSPSRRRSPPSTGPKPTASQTSQSSHIPGAFDDDLDFTATVAAGLQDTGFDPNIVINDPKFRRRDSPPGSNEPIYRAPYAETVSDLGSVMREAPSAGDGQGFIIGEVATTPKDWPVVSPDEDDTPTKLSKKEQKKREKAARRQSGEVTPLEENSKSKDTVEEPEPYFETKLSKKEQKKRDKESRRQSSQAEDTTPFDEPIGTEIVEEPESYFDEPKKKSKKSKKGSSYDDNAEETSRKVSVPIDAFDDLRNGEDKWSEKKSKRKSKRDSERYDSPSRSAPSDIASPLEKSSSLSKKSKDKKRSSDKSDPDPTEVSLPPSTPSENSRDGDFEDSRRTRKSSSKDSADRGESRSVVSADASRYDDDESRKSKRKSKTRDDFDDTRSVVSAPAGDDYEDSKRSRKKDKDKRSSGGFFGLFGSKSEVGTGSRDDSPKRSKDDFEDIKKKSKKSKRNSMPDPSSLYGDTGSQSISDLSRITSNGNGNGTYHFDDDQDRDARDETRKKNRSRSGSTSSKKDSFLAKAGTLGAGVGFAGAAVAIAAQRHQQSNADNAYESNGAAERTLSRGSSRSRQLEEILDPEITQRQFRPSIDPQYGDLLPLPPSDPVSPDVQPLDDLPDLPDSGPDTPMADRLPREKAMSSVRKTIQETPMKSPSHSAVPLKFIMGNRSNPSSPSAVRASPLQSPAATSQDSLQFPRNRSRPTSWDSTKEYKPLYLVESNRRGSNVQYQEPEEPLPALPPSQRTSRSGSQLDSSDEATFEDAEQYPRDMQVRFAESLSINTGLGKPSTELLDSQQSTPKAGAFQYLDADQDESLPEDKLVDSPSLPTHRSVSPQLEEHHDSHTKTTAEVIAGAVLVSSIGYFASSPVQRPTDKSFLDELPSHSEAQPSPVDPMTKDRSSYLLQSSPMSRKTDDEASVAHDEDSPTSNQRPLQSGKDALHSIRERDTADIFEESSEFHQSVEQERERTLDTLSGSSHEQPTAKEETGDLGEHVAVEKTLAEGEHELFPSDTKEEAEPSDEFVFTKSKKDKKKDKKKGKGLSRSSTQDDITLPEPSQAPFEETTVVVEAEPAEEFSMPKSKKDQKKRKGVSRSSTQDDFAPEEPTREIAEEPSTLIDAEPTEEFSMPKPKKDKKRDKKKDKPSMTWEPEEDPVAQIPEESFDIRRGLPEEPAAEDDFVTAEMKKGKKDKKKRKSVVTWEPEEVALSSVPIEEPGQESSRDVLEEIAAPPALGTISAAAYEAFKHSEEPTTPSQPQEESKPLESMAEQGVNVFDFHKEEKPPETAIDQRTIPIEPREEDQFLESTRDVAAEMENEPSQETSTFDDFTPSSSKSKKKGKLVSSWEPEEEQATPPPTVEEPQAVDEFVVPGSKKSKKKGRKSQTPEETIPSEVVTESANISSSQTDVPDLEETPVNDDFGTFAVSRSKKGKKKGKQSQSWTPEESQPVESERVSTEPPTDMIGEDQPSIHANADEKPGDRDFEEFVTSASKKGKKKSKLKSWDPEPESSQAQIQDDTPELGMENPLESGNIEANSDFIAPSKKGKKKSRKSQVWEEEPVNESQPETSTDKPVEPESLAPAGGLTSSGPTPIGGPGAWETAPSTPWATANEEAPKSPSTGYFPSAATLHSPQKGQSAEESKDGGYFPSAAAFLPVAAVGAAIAADHVEKMSNDNFFPETTTTGDLESGPSHSSQPDPDSTRAVPDGLKAGYDNDQLSLARQLQEEFGSGSKKSKKDKKKRQSLPATPDPEFSRARDPNENLEDRHRARSLSIGPSPGSERLGSRPMSEDRKNVYSEDQLELARQLKAEFEGGGKKSKKDKKKRSGLSRTSTQDDFDQPPEEPQNVEPEATEDITARDPAEVSRDGFDAGYQEDQLSLARQLQAEFGSGSKKSKEKKRRSTSQTPTQEPEPQSGCIGDTSQPPAETARNLESADTPGSSGIDKETARDGLAVGYNEDQLELARQLKEEFSSGSSKSKNGKKNKKRQSLLRTSAEDDFSSDYTPKDGTEPRDINPQTAELVEVGPSEPTPTEPEDEFVFSAKKSKDKKGKKRGSLAAPTDDDISFEAVPKDPDEPRNIDFQEETLELGQSETTPAEPEDEFAFTKKKPKRDKKGKKRESLTPATTAPEVPPETATKDTDESANIEDFQPAATEAEPSDPPAVNPEDEFGLIKKKSKKGKKRESLVPAAVQTEAPSEAATKDVDEPGTIEEVQPAVVDEPGTIEEVQPAVVDEAAENPEDEFGLTKKKPKKDKKGKKRGSLVPGTIEPKAPSEAIPKDVEPSTIEEALPSAIEEPITPTENSQDDFGFSRKKSKDKKGKKRDSLLPSAADDSPTPSSDDFGKAVEALRNTGELPSKEAEAIHDPVSAALEEDWTSTSLKKSKKDKKRQSLATPDDSWDQPAPEAKPAQFRGSEEPSTIDLMAIGFTNEAANEPADEFEYLTKKSKKDKKKRQNLLQSSTFDGVLETQPEESSLAQESTTQDFGNVATAPAPALEDVQDDGFEFTSKKSKKDRKKRQSLLRSSTFDDVPETEPEVTVLPEESTSRDLGDDITVPHPALEDVPDCEFEVPSKNRQSTQQPSFDEEAPVVSEQHSSKQKNQPSVEDLGREVQDPVNEAEISHAESTTREVILDDKSVEQQPAEAIGENAEAQFENLAFTTKKSKKNKKRKDSSVPPSDEPSEVSTPVEPIQDTLLAAPEAILPAEHQPEESENVNEPSSRNVADFASAEAAVGAVVQEPADEWASFSSKKSKKDKKKRKSGISTPVEETFLEPETIVPSDSVDVEEPKEMPERAANPVDDEWGSFTTKKSKKDKKNRKSVHSTPADDIPAESEAVEKSTDILSEQAQDPVEEWGSFATKKSKKDKRKSKSGPSTPLEEVVTAEPEMTTQCNLADVVEPELENREDSVDDEWGSFTTKKSKKDKKKSKSGLSTPLQETIAEPTTTSEREVIEPAAPMEEVQETFAEPEKEVDMLPAKEVNPQPEELAEDEWGSSFTTKKSKKDKKKNKSELSTPPETLAEPDSSTSQRDLPVSEEPKSQLEELMAGGVFTKKGKKDKKNKSGFSTPQEDIPQTDDRVEESQHTLEEAELPLEETIVEPEPAAQYEFQEVKPQSQEPADDEWAAFKTKKAKKGKKSKSGLSTPLDAAPQPEFTPHDDQFKDEPASTPVEDAGEEQWGSFATKKSKKDKKRKSGLSTPLEEPVQPKASSPRDLTVEEEPQPELPSTEQDLSAAHIDEIPEQPDDALEFTTKKSKKDKKRKSGLSTPIEEPALPTEADQTERAEIKEISSEAIPTEPEKPKLQPSFTEPEVEHTKDLAQAVDNDQEATEDAFNFVTKKSKRDKKKRKSGLSTPIEETLPTFEPEESFQAQPAEVNASQSQPLPTEPEMETSRELPVSTSNDQEASDEVFGFITKKSKKKRKSGISTPIEDILPPVEQAPFEPQQSSRELGFNEPTAQSETVERDISEDQSHQGESQVQAPEVADEGFEFTTKNFKKDKKGKRASRMNSESGPSTFASASVPPTGISTEEQAHLVSERFTQGPVPFEKDPPAEETITEPHLTTTTQRDAPVETKVDEFPLDLGRKPSKKDKKKRQATVANINDSPEASKAPLTSWADEVEEAEVEREAPIIEDIAKDESLSHIASTTETAPINDFSRPTKKGKKGKKRNSGLARGASIDESFRPSIGEHTSENKPDAHSDIPILAATGAALAGTALLSRKSEDSAQPTKQSATATEEAGIPQPTRKSSKKEKRKQSIDRRTPKDDPFDDPALWEGAEPRSFEEFGDENDDAGSDGFWSAPNRDEEVPMEEPLHASEAPHKAVHEGPIDLFATSRVQEPSHERLADDDKIRSGPSRDLSRPEQQENNLLDEYVTSASKKDKERKNSSRLAASDTPQEQVESREIELPSQPPPPLPEPPRNLVEESHVGRRAPFEQPPSTPPNEFVEESPIDRNLSFQDDQFRPRSSLRYSHHGTSDLPIVREESPAQMEYERFDRPSYSYATDDVNRDSAFVTDSPIPGQRPFADEHIRDSGVHLRDSSPAERAVAPVSNSDDAIARLSWPSVDEKTDTVDLHISQRPKVETPRHEKDTGAMELHRPHHEHEDGDLHRHYTEGGRPRHHDEDRDRDHLPSQQHEETHADLHRTKTIHRSQKPDSIVKKRVQRIESPDFHRSQTPKEDKYGDLSTSQRPKAEKPRISSDTSTGTVAAIAGATVGFAAARQASREQRPGSAQSQRSSSNINRLRTPDPKILRPESVGSNRSSGTPPLRRSDRKSGDLRSLSQRSNLDLAKEVELGAITAAAVTASTTAASTNPQANEGRVRAKEMADVYVIYSKLNFDENY